MSLSEPPERRAARQAASPAALASAGGEVVAHGVDDGQVQAAVVQGVVEGVAADVVGGFEDRRGGDLRRADGPRRQEGPQQFGLHRHRPRAFRLDQQVAVGGLRHHEQGGDPGERLAPPEQAVVQGGCRHHQDADAFDPVDHRQPGGGAVPRPLRLLRAVGQARQRGVDVERRLVDAVRPGQCDEPDLLEVGDVHGRCPEPHAAARVLDEARELPHGPQVGAGQQIAQDILVRRHTTSAALLRRLAAAWSDPSSPGAPGWLPGYAGLPVIAPSRGRVFAGTGCFPPGRRAGPRTSWEKKRQSPGGCEADLRERGRHD